MFGDYNWSRPPRTRELKLDKDTFAKGSLRRVPRGRVS